MATVFISYRREDSKYQARSIYNAFVKALPPGSVFMDVDSIKPGDDFVEILEGWVQQCELLLALIGPGWINSADPKTGLPRLDNPEDFVRIEIRGALERKIPVVPVLLDAAQMPAKDELPGDINALTRRHAEFVDFRTFDTDVERLIRRLQIGKDTAPIAPDPAPTAVIDGHRRESEPDVRATRWISRSFSRPVMAMSLLVVGALWLAAVLWIKNPATIDPADGQGVQAAIAVAEAGRTRAADSLAKSEKGRRDAEAAASTASDALAKAEAARQAAEKKAGAAADALAQSEKTRQASEAKASAASANQAKAEAARQDAESRASALADALAKSEQARKEAKTLTADPQAKGQPTDALSLKDLPSLVKDLPRKGPPKSRTLLSDIGSNSRWAIGGTAICSSASESFSLEVGGGSITWADGLGGKYIETIVSSNENSFYTKTSASPSVVSRASRKGAETYAYWRQNNSLFVQPSNGSGFYLERCR